MYIIARLHGRMGLHPSSFVAFYLKRTVSREERAYTLSISLLNCMDGAIHPSSLVAFYLKGTVSREERAYKYSVLSVLDCLDGWGYILVAL